MTWSFGKTFLRTLAGRAYPRLIGPSALPRNSRALRSWAGR